MLQILPREMSTIFDKWTFHIIVNWFAANFTVSGVESVQIHFNKLMSIDLKENCCFVSKLGFILYI